MAAGTYNLTLLQGQTEVRDLAIKDDSNVAIDITGWSFAAQVRSSYASNDVLATPTVAILVAASGTARMTFSAAVTAAIPYREGRTYVWDLEGTRADGTVIRILQGSVTIDPEVTR
jgi:hypothetical protein